MKSIVLVALLPVPLAAVSLSASASAARDAAKQMLRAAGVVAPLQLDQRLLLCNAYPSESPVTAQLNGKDVLGGGDVKGSIAFQECRYTPSKVQAQDRLDFDLRDAEVRGTFEVGDLPNSDAVLLLVLEKRDASPMMSFKSFAFPSAEGRDDAQLAIINTFKGNMTEPHLEVEDHVVSAPATKGKKTPPSRSEWLNFNSVYSVEPGSYDMRVADRGAGKAGRAPKDLRLAKGTNYVVLRTAESGAPDSGDALIVYPEAPLPSSARRAGATLLAFFAALRAFA